MAPSPFEIVLHPDDTVHARSNLNGVSGVLRGAECSGQMNDPVIAINHHRMPVSYTVVGQRSLDLSNQ